MTRAELLRYRLPAIMWAAFLLGISGNAASSGRTESIVRAVVTLVVGTVSDPSFEAIHFVIRKSGHVIGYAIAGALNFYAIRGRQRGWLLQWSAVAVVLAVLTASLDEWHQAHVASRTGVPTDVLIDFCGALLAQVGWRIASVRGSVSSRA